MLWAGGDPFARGIYDPGYDEDVEDGWTALELAAYHGHKEILKLKSIKIDPEHPGAKGILKYACRSDTSDCLRELLKQGLNPANYRDKGSDLIDQCVQSLHYALDSDWFRRSYVFERKIQ